MSERKLWTTSVRRRWDRYSGRITSTTQCGTSARSNRSRILNPSRPYASAAISPSAPTASKRRAPSAEPVTAATATESPVAVPPPPAPHVYDEPPARPLRMSVHTNRRRVSLNQVRHTCLPHWPELTPDCVEPGLEQKGVREQWWALGRRCGTSGMLQQLIEREMTGKSEHD